MTKFTGNNSKEIVRRMIREAVRSRMGLMTEGETTKNGEHEVSLSGTNLDDITVSWRAPVGEIVIALAVNTPEASADWNKENKINEDIPNPFSLKNWAKKPGLCTVTLTFGTWDGSSVKETKAVTSNIDLAETPPAAAPPAAAPPADDAPAADSPVAPAPEPQETAMSIQDKIRTSAKAIQNDFADVYTAGISLKDVKSSNDFPDHTWVENTVLSRDQFNLNDFSTGAGYNDEYTYFALVNNDSKKPIAFVVASDPTKDGHFSTGRFIGPTSQRSSLKNAFCVLYHRATGEVHESCRDGASTGSEDDKYGKGGKSKKGGTDSDSSSKGSEVGSPVSAKGPGAMRLVSKDGIAVKGRGDAMTGILGISLRPAEKLRGAGYKIITKSKNKQGFTNFPDGPDVMFKRDPNFTAGGKIPPSSIAVRFKNPMAIITDENGQNPRINFGANKSSTDILFIRLGWGGRGVRLVKLNPNDPGFDVAAAWVLANQEEFDLSPDAVTVTNTVNAGTAANTATGPGVRPAANRVSSLSESVSRRSLLDLYRF